MMRTFLLAATASAALLSHANAQEKAFPAKLEAHAVLPAATFVEPPKDAPASLATSAKFTSSDFHRAGDAKVAGKDGTRLTGLNMPFDGQPIQGFSGIKKMDDGTFWSLSDNGFGSKINSADAALMIHHLSFDWDANKVNRLDTVFLSDPNEVAPFPIVNEGSESRYLTGADFDVESIQPVEDGFWIGEEFGPYLLKFNKDGELETLVETKIGDKPVTSPDNPFLRLPGNPATEMPAFNLKRSGGYEGLASSPDKSKLYGLLEGPVYVDGEVEKVDGHPALRIIEFDVAKGEWTGRSWLYPLAEGGEAIGDFNMIDDTHGLVIERDNGAGSADEACDDPKSTATDCFANPARLKRIYKIEMTDEMEGGPVRKIGYIDLLKIDDTDGKKVQGGGEGFYDMPFVTIENVDVVDPTHIVVGNDNNLPFSAGRSLDKADDNEFVLLDVGDFLKAE